MHGYGVHSVNTVLTIQVILVVSLPVQLIKILLRKYKAYIYAMLAMSLLICLNFLKNLSECLNERTSVILPR